MEVLVEDGRPVQPDVRGLGLAAQGEDVGQKVDDEIVIAAVVGVGDDDVIV